MPPRLIATDYFNGGNAYFAPSQAEELFGFRNLNGWLGIAVSDNDSRSTYCDHKTFNFLDLGSLSPDNKYWPPLAIFTTERPPHASVEVKNWFNPTKAWDPAKHLNNFFT